MVFQALSAHPELWSLYRESQPILESHFPRVMAPGSSDVVTAASIDDATSRRIQEEFFDGVGNAESGNQLIARSLPLISRWRLSSLLTKLGHGRKVAPIRIVEKTPENCFRIPMLERLFPDAQYVYVVRDPRGSIGSIYHGWKHETRFQGFELPDGFVIKGYEGGHWSFGLPPDWERLDGCTLMEICAYQWRVYNEFCHRDLPTDPDRVLEVRYEELSDRPGPVLRQLADWAGIDPRPLARFNAKLPIVNTRTKPSPDKWRRFEDEINPVLPQVADESIRLGYEPGC